MDGDLSFANGDGLLDLLCARWVNQASTCGSTCIISCCLSFSLTQHVCLLCAISLLIIVSFISVMLALLSTLFATHLSPVLVITVDAFALSGNVLLVPNSNALRAASAVVLIAMSTPSSKSQNLFWFFKWSFICSSSLALSCYSLIYYYECAVSLSCSLYSWSVDGCYGTGDKLPYERI